MKIGDLNRRIDILTLVKAGNIYTWDKSDTIWAKAESLDKTNLFSKVGIGVKSVKFTVRKRALTFHQAFRWQGQHCFLTDIKEIDRMYYEVTAALIEPKTCTVKRTGEPVFDALNRPVYGEPTILTFPACLTEKYLGRVQENPMATVETIYVLVTPKVITLETGELVKVGSTSYEALIPHTLDDYKNEYEISVKGDA